jgi:hypothetical protein
MPRVQAEPVGEVSLISKSSSKVFAFDNSLKAIEMSMQHFCYDAVPDPEGQQSIHSIRQE